MPYLCRITLHEDELDLVEGFNVTAWCPPYFYGQDSLDYDDTAATTIPCSESVLIEPGEYAITGCDESELLVYVAATWAGANVHGVSTGCDRLMGHVPWHFSRLGAPPGIVASQDDAVQLMP